MPVLSFYPVLDRMGISYRVWYVLIWYHSEAGESIVTVAFKSKEKDRMNILFAIKKKCSGATADEGVAINGLNIGAGVSNKRNIWSPCTAVSYHIIILSMPCMCVNNMYDIIVGAEVMFNGIASESYAPTLDKDKKR